MIDTSSNDGKGPFALQRPVAAMLRLGSYTLAIFGLSSLFHLSYVDSWPLWIVPMLSELFLIGTEWTTARFAKAIGSRFIGIVAGSALAYFLYVLPFVGDDQPYRDDFAQAMIFAALQVPFAAAAWLIDRSVFPLERQLVSIMVLAAYVLIFVGCMAIRTFTLRAIPEEFAAIFVLPALLSVLVMPFVAEIALIGSEWTRGNTIKAISSRSLGILATNAIYYYVYVLHFVYDGKDPYGEDLLLTMIFVALETPIAVGAWLLNRKLFPAPSAVSSSSTGRAFG